MAESAILKQLREYQEAARVSAEWNDLVSIEEISEKTRKSIRRTKDLLDEKGLMPKCVIGKSYMYSKAAVMEAFGVP
jgi:hypothetical protein